MQLGDILSSAIGAYQGATQPQSQRDNMASMGNSAANGIMDLAGYLKRRKMAGQNQDTGAMPPTAPAGFDTGAGGGFGGWDPNGTVNA